MVMREKRVKGQSRDDEGAVTLQTTLKRTRYCFLKNLDILYTDDKMVIIRNRNQLIPYMTNIIKLNLQQVTSL